MNKYLALPNGMLAGPLTKDGIRRLRKHNKLPSITFMNSEDADYWHLLLGWSRKGNQMLIPIDLYIRSNLKVVRTSRGAAKKVNLGVLREPFINE